MDFLNEELARKVKVVKYNNSIEVKFDNRRIELHKPLASSEDNRLVEDANILKIKKLLEKPQTADELKQHRELTVQEEINGKVSLIKLALSNEAIALLHYATGEYMKQMSFKSEEAFVHSRCLINTNNETK